MNPPSNSLPGQAAFDEGLALVNKGYRDQGEALLQEATRLGHPHAARIIVEARLANQVVSLAQAGQLSLAVACLNDAQRQPSLLTEQFIAQLRQLLDKFKEGQFVKPTNKEGWNHMGATLLDAGKFNEAGYCFHQAIQLDSQYETAWLNLGLALSRSNEFQKALLVFDRLLAIKPNSFHGLNLKGMILGKLQKYNEAIACFDWALRLDPSLAEAWYNKSLALGHLQRQEESLLCCEKALRLNPRHLSALLQKARALHRLGRNKAEVLACYEQMNRIDPVATGEFLKADNSRKLS